VELLNWWKATAYQYKLLLFSLFFGHVLPSRSRGQLSWVELKFWQHQDILYDYKAVSYRFESWPGLLCTKVYSAFHPSGVGKWVPAAAGKAKAKAGMAHSDCGWTCGCAGKTVKYLENTCHTWALLRWWFTMKRRYIKCMDLYLLIVYLTQDYSVQQDHLSE